MDTHTNPAYTNGNNRQKTLGLALGSGGARGLAHIGVIEALNQQGIDIDCIAGTSIGALVGASAASQPLEELHKFSLNLNWKVMTGYFDFVFPQKGLLQGDKIIDLLNELLPVKDFKELSIPLTVISTNIRSGEEVDLKEGNLIEALRASFSLPGIMTPYKLGDESLVDGGIVNPVPVDVVRRMGADVVLAIDLNNDLQNRNGRRKTLRSHKSLNRNRWIEEEPSKPAWVPKAFEERYMTLEQSVKNSIGRWLEDEDEDQDRDLNIFDVMINSLNIMEFQVTQSNLRKYPADILIKPQLGHLNLFDYNEAEATIKEGYELTMAQMDHIQRLLETPTTPAQ